MKRPIRLLFLIPFLLMNSAWAAPFLTDDTAITDYRHVELYVYSMLNNNDEPSEEPQLQAPAIEFDLGLSQNAQMQIIAPYSWALPLGDQVPATSGIGDFQVAFKYRFVKDDKNKFEMAIFPAILIPFGDAGLNIGNGESAFSIPMWAEKKWGKWTLNAGGGYALNYAINNSNFPFVGCELQRELNSHFTLGLEIFSQGKVTPQTRSFTLLNVGGIYSFTDHVSLLFSVGNSVLGERHLVAYFGFEWTGGG